MEPSADSDTSNKILKSEHPLTNLWKDKDTSELYSYNIHR